MIEIGAGNGLNFPHYPPEAERVLAVEPESRLRAPAATNARTAPIDIRVVADRVTLRESTAKRCPCLYRTACRDRAARVHGDR